MSRREREYMKAMKAAVMPELESMLLEQARRFRKVAERFDRERSGDESKEPTWYAHADIAVTRLGDLFDGAKRALWNELKTRHEKQRPRAVDPLFTFARANSARSDVFVRAGFIVAVLTRSEDGDAIRLDLSADEEHRLTIIDGTFGGANVGVLIDLPAPTPRALPSHMRCIDLAADELLTDAFEDCVVRDIAAQLDSQHAFNTQRG